MKELECFRVQHLNEILRNVLSISDDDQLDFDVNADDQSLNVKGNGTTQNYVLVSLFESPIVGTNIDGDGSSVVTRPLFVIENKFSNKFAAYEKKLLDAYQPVEVNNLEQLKLVLKTLAEYQAANLTTIENCEYKLDHLKNLNGIKGADQLVETLESRLKRLLKSDLFAKTVWSPTTVYHKSNSALILDSSSAPAMPPLYDALLYILSLTDERFRQQHFNELTKWHFDALSEALGKTLTDLYKDIQLNTLLPIAKLTVAKCLEKSEEIEANLLKYIKYPHLQPEDIYEVVKNKLKSSKFDLLSYTLNPLDERNGHLGQYFNLKCIVDFNGEIQEFVLFAKVIHSDSDFIRDFLERGIGQKEDFFYKTLIPLYKEHGLDSLMDFAPNCYLSNCLAAVLDNLTQMGFKSISPHDALDLNATKAILRKIATFHASSIILEEILTEKTGKEFRFGDTHGEYLKETNLAYEDFKEFYVKSIDGLNHFLKKFPHIQSKAPGDEDELRTKCKMLMHSPSDLVKPSKVRRNVINHGDLYVSNMLFKFNGDLIVDGVLVDFQLMRYVPPAYEVIFFIILSVSPELKNGHLNELLEYYYENLASLLRSRNINPDLVYSHQDFQDDIKEMLPPSTFMAFHYGHLFGVPSELHEEVFFNPEKLEHYILNHREEYIDRAFDDETYRHRVEDWVDRMINVL